MAAHWPHQPDTDMFAAALNPRPKYVVSRTLREPLAWQNSTLISGDVVERIAELKREAGKDISVLGSGELVQTLIRHHLVDELSLTIDPIVLGTGKRLFRDGLSPGRFQLVPRARPSPISAGAIRSFMSRRPHRSRCPVGMRERHARLSGARGPDRQTNRQCSSHACPPTRPMVRQGLHRRKGRPARLAPTASGIHHGALGR